MWDKRALGPLERRISVGGGAVVHGVVVLLFPHLSPLSIGRAAQDPHARHPQSHPRPQSDTHGAAGGGLEGGAREGRPRRREATGTHVCACERA